MEAKVVDVVNPIPFDQIMRPSEKMTELPTERQEHDWRRKIESDSTRAEREYAATTPASSLPMGYASEAYKSVNWGLAMLFGVVMCVVMGTVWGLIAAATGYIFTLLAIAIGLAIAWAVNKGAGSVNISLVVFSFLLTIAAVFIGDVVALTIITGVSAFDIIGLYPQLISLAPGDICLGYVFGLFGAGYGAYYLWKQRSSTRSRQIPGRIPTRSTPTGVATPDVRLTSVNLGPGKPSVAILARTMTRAHIQVSFESPISQTLEAEYETKFGKAAVTLDGVQVFSGRVWGSQKIVDIRVQGSSSGNVRVRFFGVTPHIEITDGSSLIASC